MRSITPWLWFDTQAEPAAQFYVDLFPGSRITDTTRWGDGGPVPAGTVMTVTFELDGRPYVGLNGGPQFPFTEAFSLQVECQDQDEVDRYWDALTAEGGKESQCGWLKDRWGMSWQIVPRALPELLAAGDAAAVARVTQAMLGMRRIVVADLQRAFEG